MPNINLIAARREEKKRLERTTRQLFFGVAGSLGCLVALGLFLATERLESASQLATAEAKIQRLQPKLDEIAKINKDTDELTPKVDILQSAKTGTQRWRAILQVVSEAVPQETWLSGLRADGANDDTTIVLSGYSANQTLVGEAMTRLGTHPLFDRVELRFTQSDALQRFQFEIGAHLRGDVPPPPVTPGAAPGAPAPQKAAQAAPAAKEAPHA